MRQSVREERAQNQRNTIGRVPNAACQWRISINSRQLRTHLLRNGCSRRVHHIDTMMSMDGEILASQAPRMKRNTSRPGNEVNAAQIMHDAPQPKKQARIQ